MSSFVPDLNNIQFIITEEKRNQNIFTFLGAEMGEFDTCKWSN